ncbi:MAG: XapX domain-containing protein [Gemmatimonadota bacterium]
MEEQVVAVPMWVGILLALVIGALVRLARLPIPAPPTLYGALMVLGLTGGYLLMNWYLTR